MTTHLSNLALDEAEGGGASTAHALHLAECPQCRARLEARHAAASAIRQDPRFEQVFRTLPRPAPQRQPRSWSWALPIAAAAAIVAVIVSIPGPPPTERMKGGAALYIVR